MAFTSLANDCKRETYKVIYKKSHKKDMPKNEKIPSTLQMKPTIATIYQELVSICEIKNIKVRRRKIEIIKKLLFAVSIYQLTLGIV